MFICQWSSYRCTPVVHPQNYGKMLFMTCYNHGWTLFVSLWPLLLTKDPGPTNTCGETERAISKKSCSLAATINLSCTAVSYLGTLTLTLDVHIEFSYTYARMHTYRRRGRSRGCVGTWRRWRKSRITCTSGFVPGSAQHFRRRWRWDAPAARWLHASRKLASRCAMTIEFMNPVADPGGGSLGARPPLPQDVFFFFFFAIMQFQAILRENPWANFAPLPWGQNTVGPPPRPKSWNQLGEKEKKFLTIRVMTLT